MLYRAYSSTRARDLQEWAEEWLPPQFRGGVRHGEARELSIALGLDLEEADALGEVVFGASIDAIRRYEFFARPILFGIERELGLDEGLADS